MENPDEQVIVGMAIVFAQRRGIDDDTAANLVADDIRAF